MILALVLGGMLSAQAQHVQESKFCSPFDFPILLSANFGELRPNHFHNGLDIKTQGVTGKPIHCIADGYVSRVAVLHGTDFGVWTRDFLRKKHTGLRTSISVCA